MNFFEQQEQARKLSFRLLVLMLLSLVSLITLTALVIAIFLYYFQNQIISVNAAQLYNQTFIIHIIHLVQSNFFLWIAISVSGFVFIGSLYKHISLRQGGTKIAMALGGKLLQPDTQETGEKKLRNIVEEMAIASGSPMPDIFLLPESGINAFAAGHAPQSAVIGVTQGCIEQLSREELQGVIAHEFSHIHNGDMRLNLQLIAILHGILLIGLIGQMIIRGSFYPSHRSYSVTQKRKTKDGRLIFLGFALVGIGYGGTFFGRLIKSAVSRQREFLADASAIQFTRNPNGIGGALNKIAFHNDHSKIKHPRSNEFSHMYFANALDSKINTLLSTHPPIQERLRKIFPNGIPKLNHSQSNLFTKKTNTQTPKNYRYKKEIIGTLTTLEHAIEQVGNTSNIITAIQNSKKLKQKIPNNIVEATHNAYSARAVVYALSLSKKTDDKQAQNHFIKTRAHPRTLTIYNSLSTSISNLNASFKFMVLEMCMPSLSNLSGTQDAHFKSVLKNILSLNSHPELFEWCVFQRVINHNQQENLSNHSLDELFTPISNILICIAKLTTKNHKQKAFLEGLLIIWPEYRKSPKSFFTRINKNANLNTWSSSLSEIRKLRALSRPAVLKAIAKIIEYDQEITQNELDTFRLMSSILDCPIPQLTLSDWLK